MWLLFRWLDLELLGMVRGRRLRLERGEGQELKLSKGMGLKRPRMGDVRG